MTNFYKLSIRETEKTLGVSSSGLSSQKAKNRVESHGKNVLPRAKPLGPFFILISQLKNALVYILIAAAVISVVIAHMIDFYVILTAILVNVIVGFVQEYKAQKALYKLRSYVTEKTTVLRDGKKQEIDTELLVPGDRIFLKPGDKVPADIRLCKAVDLKINEAVLTGESGPQKKQTGLIQTEIPIGDRDNMAFKGTSVIEGVGEGIVAKTGSGTEFGKIALMLREVKEENTPLQDELKRFSRWLGLLVITASGAIFITGMLIGRPVFDMFILAIALAVSAIPEGLVIGVTAILAVGMKRILDQKALTRKLVAAETLGSTTVICSDKTGTLTTGQMEVTEILTSPIKDCDRQEGFRSDAAILNTLGAGVLASDAYISNPDAKLKSWKVFGNSTEQPIIRLAAELGIFGKQLARGLKEVFEIPFDSANKYMVKVYRGKDGNYEMYAKGAPEKLLDECGYFIDCQKQKRLTSTLRSEIVKNYEKMTKKGLRVLCVAKAEDSEIPIGEGDYRNPKFKKPLVFLGLLGIKDPLRPGVGAVLKNTLLAGLRPIIITGDNKATAMTIAREAGIKIKPDEVLEGGEIDKLSDKAMKRAVKKVKLYARVAPEHKMRIVDALQKNSEVVAMTGDGLNDAPAIKSADIGIAVGGGSEVTKETADMVLLNNDLKVIVAAIREGRGIFENIRKVVLYLLSDSFTELLLVIASFVFGFPLPVLAVQILWVNLIDDSLPNLALTLDPQEDDLMKDPPRPKREKILNNPMKMLIGAISIITGVAILVTFLLMLKNTGDLERARTIAFTLLGLDSLLYVFSIRFLHHSVFNPKMYKKIFNNSALVVAVLVGIALQLAAVYVPVLQRALGTKALSLYDWCIIIPVALGVFLAIELSKGLLAKFHARRKASTS